MIPWLLASAAQAATGSFCFDITTDYTDLGGDFWTTNANRPARGVLYKVEQPAGTVIGTGYLDGAGCGTVTLNNTQNWRVRVRSEALWKGVEFKSWSAFCHSIPPTPSPAYSNWTSQPANDTKMEVVVASNARWRNLVLATWAIHRNKHGLGTGVSRTCCQEGNPNYQADGTCSSGPSDYIPIPGPVYLYANPLSGQSGDWIDDCGSNPAGHRALNITSTVRSRTQIAHEFGHLITSLRMGWSDEMWSLTAPLDGCMGDFVDDGSPSDSPNNANRRGEFSKEYLASAIREGYADFYSMWLWNSRKQSDCVFDLWTLHDFDLDCDVDDYFGVGDGRNGQVDCADDWEVAVADPADPTTAYSDGKNWLKDLQNASDVRWAGPASYTCGGPGSTFLSCTSTPSYGYDRATMMDLAKFYWKLNQVGEGGLSPKTVTDLYIDTCPRGWDTENGPSGSLAHPYQRLLLSSDAHSIRTEVETYDDYFVP